MANNRPHWADTAIAVFTGLMLFTYITANYFSCQQLRLTKRTFEEIQKGGTDTHALAEAAGKQADAARATAESTKDIAKRARLQADATNRLAVQTRRAFDITNRPYVGVATVGGLYVWKDEAGAETNEMPTPQATSLSWRIAIKNFGPVPGTNYEGKERVFVDGVERFVGEKEAPDLPSLIFPGQTFYLTGNTGMDLYPSLMSKQKILTIEVTVEYDGPNGHTKYCQKEQFSPAVNGFWGLGPTCSHK